MMTSNQPALAEDGSLVVEAEHDPGVSSIIVRAGPAVKINTVRNRAFGF